MSRSWNVGLDTLQVLNADEDNWGSDGDEIYVVVVAFRSKLGQPGSTQTWTNSWQTYGWAKHVKQGAVRAIPANIGRATFANVAPFGLDEFTGSRKEPANPAYKPEIMGIVSLAFESDDSSWGSMAGIINKAEPVIHQEVEKLIAGETTPLAKLTAAALSDKLVASANHIKDAITPSLLNKIALALSSGGDPDDYIDYGINWYSSFDPGFIQCFQALKEGQDAHDKGIPLPADHSAEGYIARSGLNPLRPVGFENIYDKSGVKYRVLGSVS